MRLAVIAEERVSTLVPPCILGAVYAANPMRSTRMSPRFSKSGKLAAENEQLHRVCEQAERAGIHLGADIPRSDAMPKRATPRPRIVIVNGAESAIRTAAAGGTGLLIMDDRRAPWLANVGNNFDLGTDNLLNTVAAGYPIQIEDPTTGRVNMRFITAGVIGALDLSACDALYECNKSQFSGTIFMPKAIPPSNGRSHRVG